MRVCVINIMIEHLTSVMELCCLTLGTNVYILLNNNDTDMQRGSNLLAIIQRKKCFFTARFFTE